MQPIRPGEWSAVDEAVSLVGGPTKAAVVCRVTFQAVYKWRVKGKVSDSESAVRLSEGTGNRVTVRQLAGLDPWNGPGGEPAQEPAATATPRAKLHVVEPEPPANEVAYHSQRRLYGPPAVQKRRRPNTRYKSNRLVRRMVGTLRA